MSLPVSLFQSDLHFQSVIKLVPQARGCHGNKTGIPAPAASPVPRATHEISICTSVFVSKEETHFSHNFSRLWNKALENDAKTMLQSSVYSRRRHYKHDETSAGFRNLKCACGTKACKFTSP